jgi:hypothetical protein
MGVRVDLATSAMQLVPITPAEGWMYPVMVADCVTDLAGGWEAHTGGGGGGGGGAVMVCPPTHPPTFSLPAPYLPRRRAHLP